MTEKIKKNALLIIGNFFIWIVPIICLMIMALSTHKGGEIKLSIWGGIVGIIIVCVYFLALRKKVENRVQFEKQEQLKVPVWLRLIQGAITLISLLAVICIINATREMFYEILMFLYITTGSVAVGYIFLVIDSKKRKAKKIIRQSE